MRKVLGLQVLKDTKYLSVQTRRVVVLYYQDLPFKLYLNREPLRDLWRYYAGRRRPYWGPSRCVCCWVVLGGCRVGPLCTTLLLLCHHPVSTLERTRGRSSHHHHHQSSANPDLRAAPSLVTSIITIIRPPVRQWWYREHFEDPYSNHQSSHELTCDQWRL